MTDYRVRTAEPADVDRIFELDDSSFPGELTSRTHADYLKLAEIGDPYLFVATHDEEVIGFLLLSDRPRRPWTSADVIAIDERHRRKRVSIMLSYEALIRTKRPMVRLYVKATNTAAHQLYRKFGFFSIGRRRGHYPDGIDAFVMVTLLPFIHRNIRRFESPV